MDVMSSLSAAAIPGTAPPLTAVQAPNLVSSQVQLPSRGPGYFQVYQTPASPAIVTYLLLFHGAGLTSKSFFALVQALPKNMGAWMFDCRGHGGTTVEPQDDWSTETLVEDARALLEYQGWMNASSSCFLVGHSLGGSVATRCAWKGAKGLVVIDAVEGIALSAIESGAQFLRKRPAEFNTQEDAIIWSLSQGPLHGTFSARFSVPDQLVKTTEGRFKWRTDLIKTMPFWSHWFAGLSELFLAAPCPKLLLLAGVERLDTPLSAGHMMGKYQLVCLADVTAGHFVHEDAPGKTAGVISMFVNRYTTYTSGGLSAEQVIALNKLSR